MYLCASWNKISLSSEYCYYKNDVVLHVENELLVVVTYSYLVGARDCIFVNQIYLNLVDAAYCQLVAGSEM